jgi:hypothetical protein
MNIAGQMNIYQRNNLWASLSQEPDRNVTEQRPAEKQQTYPTKKTDIQPLKKAQPPTLNNI